MKDNKEKKNSSNESKPRTSKNSRHSRTLSGDNNKSGRNSIPFMVMEEEKELPIREKDKNTLGDHEAFDEPLIATNLDEKLPDSIFDEA